MKGIPYDGILICSLDPIVPFRPEPVLSGVHFDSPSLPELVAESGDFCWFSCLYPPEWIHGWFVIETGLQHVRPLLCHAGLYCFARGESPYSLGLLEGLRPAYGKEFSVLCRKPHIGAT